MVVSEIKGRDDPPPMEAIASEERFARVFRTLNLVGVENGKDPVEEIGRGEEPS